MAISLFRSFSLRDVLKLALLPVFAGILSAQGPEFKLQQLPLNPAYLEWQAKQRERAEMAALGFTVEADDTTSFRTGYIPPPFLWPKVDGPLTQIEAMVNAGLATFDSMHFIGDPSASTYWSTYLRDIKNQNPYGTCWAFAALASMESNILLNGGAGVDFSPRHLAWFAYNPINGYPAFPTGGVSGTEIFNNGGHSQMALAIMSRGPGAGGPVAETSAPYSGMPAAPSASATAIATVTGTYFPGTLDGKNTGDRTAIKGLICTHGAVAVAINMAQDSAHFNSSTSAYRNTATGTNHGVNVVGWDDNYPLSNFPAGNQPTSHGAWIIRNSWGTGFGDGGYFYVSYDTFLDDFASFEASTQIDSKVYQHDMLGARAYYSMSQKTVWFSNIFTATGNQGVTGVAFYTGYNNASYEITVKTGVTGDPNTGTVVLGPVSGMVGLPGYQRVYLPSPAVVASGQQFAVIVKLTENTNADIYCTGGAVSGGRTYISSSGSYWQNTTSDAGICLKAFAESASLTSVTFTATQTGGTSDTTNSTGIALNFSQAVSGLTASNINITNGTGSVTKGTLTGSGTSWNIGVTVATQGNVSVSISDFGGFSVTTSPQTVAVYKALPTPVTFTAIQKGGTSNTADTTGIELTFNQTVTGLSASNITISNDTGSATKGSLSGSGTTWTIAVTPITQGDVSVDISDFGSFSVTTSPQTVAVYKAPSVTTVTFSATQVGGTSSSADSTGIELTFSQAVTGLSASNITITDGTGSVTKGTLSGSGTTWTIAVTPITQGNVSVSVSDFGSYAVTTSSQSVTVYKAVTTTPVTFSSATQVGGVSNTTNTTSIALNFSTGITGLQPGHITITDGTGSVTKGSLTGSGTSWNIGVTPVTEGSVTISIANFENYTFSPSSQTVTVYKATTTAPVTFSSATQVGGVSNTTNTTSIALNFSPGITGLQPSHITITNGTGSVTMGTLSGSGTSWTIGVTPVTEGSVTVSIANFGNYTFSPSSQTVTVYKAVATTPVTFTAFQVGGVSDTANSTGIVLTFSQPVTGLSASNITITNGTGNVTKGTLSGSGTTYALGITVATQGDVSVGISDFGSYKVNTSPQTVAVYKAIAAIPVTGVTLNKPSITLLPGGSESLTASVSPTNATNTGVKWVSSNNSVASVSGYGTTINVVAHSPGSATITVTTDDGNFSANCTVLVETVPAYVNIIDPPSAMATGQTLTFIADVVGVSNKAVIWSATGGGTINPSTGAYTAPATATTVTITATSVENATLKANVSVIIKTPIVDGNTKTTPQLLHLANLIGVPNPSLDDLLKYDLNGDGKIDEKDIELLFIALGW